MPNLRGCDFPADLLYHPDSHLWFAPLGGSRYRVGISRFGVALAGEILLFTPKPTGVELAAGRGFGLLEAGKTVFAVRTPIAARVACANPALDPSARAQPRPLRRLAGRTRRPGTIAAVRAGGLERGAAADRAHHGPLRLSRSRRFRRAAVP
ncbi:MAG: hypothetical protein KIS72_05840 [Luteimonas sp.]|nr:hypothetical protein [Luteimonas sp.]